MRPLRSLHTFLRSDYAPIVGVLAGVALVLYAVAVVAVPYLMADNAARCHRLFAQARNHTDTMVVLVGASCQVRQPAGRVK